MQGASRRRAAHAPAALAVIAAALLLVACSRSEPESKVAAPAAPIVAQPKSGEIALDPAAEAALKERLARQEAASKLFERNVLQPSPPKAAEPKPAPEVAKVPEPPPAPKEPPKPVVAAAPVEAPKAVAPAPAAAPKPVAASPAPATTAPAPAKAPPRTEVAAAKPSAAPESATPRLVSRVEPEFPAEAVRGGVDRGRVVARLTVDASGAVSNVQIVEAQPRRVFDRAVERALAQWKFNPGAAGRIVDSEVDFRR